MGKSTVLSIILTILIPGLGHIYLKSYKIGLLLIIAGILTASITFSIDYTSSETIDIISYISYIIVVVVALVHVVIIARQ